MSVRRTLRHAGTLSFLALVAATLTPIGCGSEVVCRDGACDEDGDGQPEEREREERECSDLPPCGDDVECAPGEEDDCYEIDLCGGGTLLCREVEDKCAAWPSCDDDDIEVGECPSDASCYEASLCGWTTLCLDQGLPHGCPTSEPTEGNACDPEIVGQLCDYYDDVGCFSTYECSSADVDWVWVGGGCDQVG